MSEFRKLPAPRRPQRTRRFETAPPETALSRVRRGNSLDRPALRLRLRPGSPEYNNLVAIVEDESARNMRAAKRAEGLARLIDGQTEEEIVLEMDVSRSTVRSWAQKLDRVQRKLEKGVPVRTIRYEFDL